MITLYTQVNFLGVHFFPFPLFWLLPPALVSATAVTTPVTAPCQTQANGPSRTNHVDNLESTFHIFLYDNTIIKAYWYIHLSEYT